MELPVCRAGRLQTLRGTWLGSYPVVYLVFLCSPLTNVFLCGAQEPQSVLVLSCLLPNTNIRGIKEVDGVVEEGVRAMCTEFVPAEPGVQLDVPGENGKLWAAQG